MKRGIIIQSRMSSNRLKGKTLKLLHNKPMIYWLIDRMRRVQNKDVIVIATSDERDDDALAEYISSLDDVYLFRGSLDNVQRRFSEAARELELDTIVRVTGDNPLISHRLIDLAMSEFDKLNIDYMGMERCVLGTGSEIFTVKSFSEVVASVCDDYDREHVTPPYYKRNTWTKQNYIVADEFFCAELRLTVDTEEDFKKMENIYAEYIKDDYVDLLQVINDYKRKVDK